MVSNMFSNQFSSVLTLQAALNFMGQNVKCFQISTDFANYMTIILKSRLHFFNWVIFKMIFFSFLSLPFPFCFSLG